MIQANTTLLEILSLMSEKKPVVHMRDTQSTLALAGAIENATLTSVAAEPRFKSSFSGKPAILKLLQLPITK